MKVLNFLQRFPEPDTNSAGTETSQVLNQKVLKYVHTLYYNCNISKSHSSFICSALQALI